MITFRPSRLPGRERQTGHRQLWPGYPGQIPVTFVRALDRFYRSKWLKLALLIILMVAVALVLSGCADYPGADPLCTGSQKNAPGCAPPVTAIKDDQTGGPWYLDWTFKIIRDMLSNLSIQSVNLGVSIFWSIFTNLSSTDFAGCGAGNGAGTALCAAVNAFSAIRTVAFVFFPAILTYRVFKSYYLGNVIEGWFEGFFSLLARMMIAGFCLMFLEYLLTGAFGISNQLFNALSGGPEGLNAAARAVVGHGWDANADPGNPMSQPAIGVSSVEYVTNIGLMIFALMVCLAMAIVFILLGVVFLLRTIIVFILFAISPLGVLAGTLDEFKPWFYKWLQSVQAMIIAPIPVAICFRLITSFANNVPSAHDNPPEFMLTMVYIISFLAIGALLMFKIAGPPGGALFGVLTAVAGFAAGGVVGALGAITLTSGVGEEEAQGSTGQTKPGKSGKQAGRNSSSSASTASVGSGQTGVETAAGNATGNSYALQELKQQAEMASAIRTLTEALKAGGSGAGSFSAGFRFDHGLQNNVQRALRWAGSEAGVSAPYLDFAPYRHHRPVISGGNTVLLYQGQNGETPPPPTAPPSPPEDFPPASLGPAYYESYPREYTWPDPPPDQKPTALEELVERNLTRLENTLLPRSGEERNEQLPGP